MLQFGILYLFYQFSLYFVELQCKEMSRQKQFNYTIITNNTSGFSFENYCYTEGKLESYTFVESPCNAKTPVEI